mmetsp:Transcript_25164/g.40907  ORF Transcript_25164/g.40907 Transcript_25164/m.40907 type:complete len:123 (-) Transcript_25164:226-594(-)|eukprot:CAMPEP_0196142288 /NCGR_PEP_ID=MMETSP0910-20130528/11496_1 /TAXON_ID=49265 /ORGANISM="Thalassiosira rotula, Strain GSO102" /LENGTH=122 /DNA_ID=CAMNT_0041403585 /DNA_START=113 /DNA_END=481 /DNA_ORIENTATION=+
MAESKAYGAIDVPEGDKEFNENDTYYLNQSQFSWSRFFRAAFPTVIAILIMGGFAYEMKHDFRHFYGPPKGTDDNDSIKQDHSWIPHPQSSGSCANNDGCVALELIGECCPTNDGVMLGCCD